VDWEYTDYKWIPHRRRKTVSTVWQIEVEGQQHLVEIQMDSFLGRRFGRLIVDSEVINRWTTSVFSGCVPSNLAFEFNGKKCSIKSKGCLSKIPLLYFDGKEVKPL
jgi:hypothetical protein